MTHSSEKVIIVEGLTDKLQIKKCLPMRIPKLYAHMGHWVLKNG